MELTHSVTVGNEQRPYPSGTPFRNIAEDFQAQYGNDILLVERNGKLCELCKALDRDCTLKMLTIRDKPGMQAYERSAIFLLLKAFYDVLGHGRIDRISVEYSLSQALFLLPSGRFQLDQALLEQVECRMKDLAGQAIPIQKHSLPTDDAIAFFREKQLYDKAKLLRFRMSSRVNYYELDGFPDYFYGYMVPDTGYIKNFKLELFQGGLVLRLPDPSTPGHLSPFRPSAKVFQALYAGSQTAKALNIPTVADLNETICRGEFTQLALAAEAMMEKQIGGIAESIARRPDVRFVMIAGPSSSGKTTFSHRLSTQLTACGLRPRIISTDNYFKNRMETPLDENGRPDFESLRAIDAEQFNQDMNRLLQGESVELPHFNFKKGVREYNGDTLALGPQDILVVEGIHCLNDAFSYALPQKSKFKIYISCLTVLNVDDHNRIPTTDARLLRRIARDARTRGYSAQATIQMWPSVRRGEERDIFPFQDSADVIFNSALFHETALLKPYVEPLLFQVPPHCPEHQEAKRLLKFLSYFLAVPADAVPQTSLIREFIGGGLFLE